MFSPLGVRFLLDLRHTEGRGCQNGATVPPLAVCPRPPFHPPTTCTRQRATTPTSSSSERCLRAPPTTTRRGRRPPPSVSPLAGIIILHGLVHAPHQQRDAALRQKSLVLVRQLPELLVGGHGHPALQLLLVQPLLPDLEDVTGFLRLLDAGQLVQQVLVLEDQGLPTRAPPTQVLLASHVHRRGVMVGRVL